MTWLPMYGLADSSFQKGLQDSVNTLEILFHAFSYTFVLKRSQYNGFRKECV